MSKPTRVKLRQEQADIKKRKDELFDEAETGMPDYYPSEQYEVRSGYQLLARYEASVQMRGDVREFEEEHPGGPPEGVDPPGRPDRPGRPPRPRRRRR